MSVLQDILDSLGAVRVEGEVRFACPNCQQGESEPAEFRAIANPGQSRLVVCRCFGCESTRAWWISVLSHYCPPDEISQSCSREQIEREWGELEVQVEAAEVADHHNLSEVYSALLFYLDLNKRDSEWLEKRGLDSGWAWASGYRSSTEDTDRLYSRLEAAFGGLLESVPGLAGGRLWLRHPSILTPSRNSRGQIVAIKQRLLTGKSRMRLLSSVAAGGPKAVNGVHYPLGVGGHQWQRLWLVEGERKADCLWSRSELPVVAVPGVGAWRLGLAAVTETVAAAGTVVLAFDRDRAGAKATTTLGGYLKGLGYRVEAAGWSTGKGIDDALVAGEEITTSEWEGEAVIARERSDRSSPTPNTPPNDKVDPNRRLKDEEIVEWIRQRGAVVRDDIRAYPPTVSKLIKSGLLRIKEYTKRGQVLEAV